MEMQQYFFSLIISIGVIHLATVAGQSLRGLRSKLLPDATHQPTASQERDDWYVFFHCADLLGKEAASPRPDRPQHEQPARAVSSQRGSASSSRRRARV